MSLNLEAATDLLIFKALVRSETKADAAKLLGMTRRNLYNVLNKKPTLWTSAQYTRTLLKSNTKKESPQVYGVKSAAYKSSDKNLWITKILQKIHIGESFHYNDENYRK